MEGGNQRSSNLNHAMTCHASCCKHASIKVASFPTGLQDVRFFRVKKNGKDKVRPLVSYSCAAAVAASATAAAAAPSSLSVPQPPENRGPGLLHRTHLLPPPPLSSCQAFFYLDPYSRPAEKRGGAWCVRAARHVARAGAPGCGGPAAGFPRPPGSRPRCPALHGAICL